MFHSQPANERKNMLSHDIMYRGARVIVINLKIAFILTDGHYPNPMPRIGKRHAQSLSNRFFNGPYS
jgi:hypothetical protein